MKILNCCHKRCLHLFPIHNCRLNSGLIFKQNIRTFCELKTYLSDFGSKHSQKSCEKFWSDFWQKNRLFSEHNSRKSKTKSMFSLLLPPPNITGSLHLGHALTLSIEDSICRYHRMNGHTVQWIPGLDHAGIATQIMVEKLLWNKYKKTRHDLTREQFISEVNDWKNKRSEEIRQQFQRLGVCLDYDKQFYTLSEKMSEAVSEAFIRLYNSGQIYRRSYPVNWSYYLRSTISDIEVDIKTITGPTLLTVPGFDGKVLVGVIHRFNYLIDGQPSDVIPVATTRLETILGDVAIAVHPNDKRYNHLIGKYAINPINGRKMKVISDDSVRPDFGTGAVKITPGLSTFDYAIAEKNSLPVIDIFDDSGRLNCPELSKFHGLHRFEAKTAMQTELRGLGLYLDQSEHKHTLPMCSRSGDLIETRRVPQWFLKCDKHKVLSKFVVNRDHMSTEDEQNWDQLKDCLSEEDRHLSIVPPNYRIVWKEWFDRFEDWCISRQIYWGHRIPAFNVIKDKQTTEEWIAAKSESEALSIATNKYPTNEITVKQDSDVLDTWFSSALLPLSINGWPKTNLREETFPLSLMETGYDILFFWVSRMVLMSLSLTDRLPFRRVLLHGMICDANGKKMSKSKGNVINPIDIIDGISLKQLNDKNQEYFESGVLTEKQLDSTKNQLKRQFPEGIVDCGADGLRLYLLQQDFKEERIPIHVNSVVSSRKFSNKMHQTVKFFIGCIDHTFQTNELLTLNKYLSPIDRWIISCLVETIKKCNQSFASYDLQFGAKALKHFWQNQLCDIYLEHLKPIVKNNSEDNQMVRNTVLNVLYVCLNTSLRAIHPFMPFISENLWQHIKQRVDSPSDQTFKSICDECYPDFSSDQFMSYFDFDVKQEMHLIDGIIQKIRWFKQNFRINKNPLNSEVLIAINGNHLEKYYNLLKNSTKVNEIKFVSIHDIHRYDKHFCYKIRLNSGDKQNSDQTEEEYQKNSYDDCYVLFDLDIESHLKSISDSGVGPQLIEQMSLELNQYKCNNFHKNFWRTKSLRESIK